MSEIVHSWGAGEQAGQDKPIVWVDGEGHAHYRASALSACQNALLMARLEYQGSAAPEWMQERFDQGHELEPMILNRVASYDNVVYAQQDTTSLSIMPTASVDGHIDGLMAGRPDDGLAYLTHYNGFVCTERMPIPGGFAVIDAKGFATSTWEKWKSSSWAAFPYYAWQQVIYALSVGAEGIVMAVYHKSDEETDGSAPMTCEGELRIEYWDLGLIGVTKADILKKVIKVERAAAAGPESIFAEECSVRMFPCPFWAWHPEDDKRKLASEGLDLDVLTTLSNAHIAADQRAKTAAAEKESISDQIRALVGNKEARIEANGVPITVYYHGSSVTDWEAIGEAAGINPVEAKQKFTSTVPSSKLSVKVTPKKRK